MMLKGTMMKKYFSFLLTIGFVLLMLNLSVGAGLAQTGGEETPTPEPSTGVEAISVEGVDPNTFTLRDLGFSERFMVGPYDVIDVYFSIPDYWQLNSNTSITVRYNYTIGGAGVSDVIKDEGWIGGTLIVRFNDDIIATELLQSMDDQTFSVTFRPESLIPKGEDSRHHLRFFLDASMNCYIDDLQTTLWIDPKSTVSFSYFNAPPELDLAEFPKPYFQADSIVPAEAVVVVPNNPTAVDLQAAYSVAAGLGTTSNGESLVSLSTVGNLTEEQLSSKNMIFVGNRFPELGLLDFPVPIVDGSFLLTADKQDNGVIQTVLSPWSDTNAIMLVGGNSDEALLKAAGAVSTGKLVTSGLPNVSLVSEVNAVDYDENPVVDQSFSSLGFQSTGIGVYGDVYYDLRFNATAEQAVSEGAYLEFISTRSDLLDFDRSGLMIILNDEIVGTIGYTGEEQEVTSEKIEILPNFIRRGENLLEIVSSLVPHDTCYQSDFEAAWVTVSDTSNIHLPITERTFNIGDRVDLDNYPTMLFRDQQLSDIAIIVPEGNMNAIMSGAQLAFYLGDRGTISLSNLAVYYAGNVPENVLENSNLIFIGKSTDFSLLAEFNDELPAPFESGSTVPDEPDMPVNFNVLQDVPVGYVQLLQSPWNEGRVIILATGNMDAGITLAEDALTQDILTNELVGNFAKIVNTQVSSVDTRLLTGNIAIGSQSEDESEDGGDGAMDADDSQPDDSGDASADDFIERPEWLQPTIIGITIFMVVVLLFVIIRYRIFSVSNNSD